MALQNTEPMTPEGPVRPGRSEERMRTIDVGDHVHHEPTGEDWIVALVDGDHLYWCGYPFGGSAALADCTLTEKATDERRNEWLNRLAVTVSEELPVLKARERLVAIRKALRDLDEGRKE